MSGGLPPPGPMLARTIAEARRLRDDAGLKPREIAVLMGLKPQTVSAYLWRGARQGIAPRPQNPAQHLAEPRP